MNSNFMVERNHEKDAFRFGSVTGDFRINICNTKSHIKT